MKKLNQLVTAPLLYYFFAFIIFLNGRPMGTPDEFRYGQIPKEMLLTGNFVAPTMFGHPYFEKPVLGYWTIAASEWLFGFNAFAVRLPMAVATGLTALMLYFAVRKASGKSDLANCCTMFYLASGLVMATGVICVLDPILCCFTTAMCTTVFFALEERNSVRKKLFLLALCGISAGLAFLTKGPIGWIFPGFAALGYIVWNRRWKELLILPLPILLFCILTVLPWALAVHRADADFWRYFVVVEHIQRFTSDAGGQHSEPFWYFVPVLLGGIFPGAVALAGAFKLPKAAFAGALKNNAIRFALCGTVLPFLFLSCSNGKLLTYLLPSFPCIGVLLGSLYYRLLQNESAVKITEKIPYICQKLFAVTGIAAIVAALFFLPETFCRFAYTAGLLLFAGSLVCKKYSKTPAAKQMDVLAVTFAFIVGVSVAALPAEASPSKFPEPALTAVKNALPQQENVRIATNSGYMHAMVWVFDNQDLILLGRKGEHDYAIDRYAAEGRKPFHFPYEELDKVISQAKADGKTLVIFYESKRQKRFRSANFVPDKVVETARHTGDIYLSGIRKK